ncbi:MAG: WYL domain-containing protein [Tannerella sp.]|jgi:predicted DNA-binding transcriptional regulator YafY|nr:WYL domain-containing protein [Tannerella sp.]
MPVNRNALIRYKTIDNCLRNPYRRWTLEDLIDACSDALYEFEGIDKGISRRTVQMDIQVMRSEKLGYNAPIEVYDKKYYGYSDPEYSITNSQLTGQDLKIMSEAVSLLKQFKGFSYFSDMTDIVSRLEDRVTSAQSKSTLVIDFEKNENAQGLEHLDSIFHAIVDRQTLSISYQSFKAYKAYDVVFYPYLLKEYRNRWFVFGVQKKDGRIYNLALDRIKSIKPAVDEPFVENTLFDIATFFDDCIGVTKNLGSKTETIKFWVSVVDKPYIVTKPFHKSQRMVTENEDGSAVFELEVVINSELQRDLFAYSEGLRVLSPNWFSAQMKHKLQKALDLYL